MKQIPDVQFYKMKLKILSPTFIGSGETYNRCDYIKDEGKIYIINQEKWIEYLLEKNLLEKFTKYLEKMGKKTVIETWLKSENQNVKQAIKRCTSTSFRASVLDNFKSNEIHGFVKNIEGQPYIPGSSIKGAIVSAIYGYYGREKNIKIKDLSYEKIPGISVSDSTPFSTDNLLVYKKKGKIVLHYDMKDEELPLYRECAMPGTEVEFTLRIDNRNMHKTIVGENLSLNRIYDVLYDKIQSLYNREIGILTEYDKTLDFIPSQAYNEKTGDFDDGVFILGGGAGFHSKSILSSLYGYDDAMKESKFVFSKGIARKHHHEKDDNTCPRALKLADVGKKVYMGFCKIEEI